MNATDLQDLAQLLQSVPGIKPLDFKDVRRLAQLLKESPEIGSIELRGWLGSGITITRVSAGGMAISPAMLASGAMAALGGPLGGEQREAPARPAPATASALKDIRSPMVGTFYKAPEPGAESYVKVGTRITTGQTVCIIEAMKIMNEIEAEVSGVVREICVEDASPVEFGQVLYRVDPNG